MKQVNNVRTQENIVQIDYKYYMKIIDELQEQNRLLKFDKIKDNQVIKELTKFTSVKNASIKEMINEAKMFKKDNNIIHINNIIKNEKKFLG